MAMGFAFPRRILGLFLAAFAVAIAGCQRTDEGDFDVTVIGEAPRLTDPIAAAPDSATAVLLANAAQGLVRFDAQGQI